MIWLLAAVVLQGSPYLHRGAWLVPDPKVTPGAVRTEDTAVVCHKEAPGVRHTSSAVKDSVYREYGFSGRVHPRGELDHLISLELGGADTKGNIWFQPDGQFQVKDQVENWTRVQVCSGRMDLSWAQATMARDWTVLYGAMEVGW